MWAILSANKKAILLIPIILLMGCVEREYLVEMKAGPSGASLESVRHYQVLKYNGMILGEIGFYRLSPTKTCLVGEVNGCIKLYIDGKETKSVEIKKSLPKEVIWGDESNISVELYSGDIVAMGGK